MLQRAHWLCDDSKHTEGAASVLERVKAGSFTNKSIQKIHIVKKVPINVPKSITDTLYYLLSIAYCGILVPKVRVELTRP